MIDPKSLIGMPQGARKRAGRRWAIANGPNFTPEYRRKLERNFGEWSAMGWPGYAAARKLYRVGERLRPCAGCTACARPVLVNRPGIDPMGVVTRAVKTMTPCDGSGVITKEKP